MRIPGFETERLSIREYERGDLEARHQLMREAFGSSEAVEDTLQWLEWTIAGYRELARLYQPPYGDYAIIVKDSGSVIGSVGIVPAVVPWGVFHDEVTSSESKPLISPEFGLFWAVLPSCQGNGYAVEAAQAVIEHLFLQLHVRRIVAMTEFDNHRSQRVMHKLGMDIKRNPAGRPPWCQVVGVLSHPELQE